MIIHNVVGNSIRSRLLTAVLRRLHLDGAVTLPPPLLTNALHVMKTVDPRFWISRIASQNAAVIFTCRVDTGLSSHVEVVAPDKGNSLKLRSIQLPPLHERSVRTLRPRKRPTS